MNYSLRKGSRKELCPSCGKRSFKPYVDEDGQILSDIVGRCDREHKCRYHLAPSQYLRERGITLSTPPSSHSGWRPAYGLHRNSSTAPISLRPLRNGAQTALQLSYTAFLTRNLDPEPLTGHWHLWVSGHLLNSEARLFSG